MHACELTLYIYIFLGCELTYCYCGGLVIYQAGA